MAYTTPTTHVAGETLPAADYNVIVNDVIDHESRIAAGEAAWTSWTPAFGTGGWATSGGSASFTGKYLKIGKHVSFWARIIMGSSITGGSALNLTLPATASAVGALANIVVMDRDFGANWYPLFVAPGDSTTSQINVWAMNAASTYVIQAAVTGTVPQTWAQNDEITYGGVYEAA